MSIQNYYGHSLHFLLNISHLLEVQERGREGKGEEERREREKEKGKGRGGEGERREREGERALLHVQTYH